MSCFKCPSRDGLTCDLGMGVTQPKEWMSHRCKGVDIVGVGVTLFGHELEGGLESTAHMLKYLFGPMWPQMLYSCIQYR